MIISKEKLCEMFFNYTCLIYRECGRNLSAKQKANLKRKVNQVVKQYTLKEQIKEKMKERKNKNV